jgi:hypothetical protein
MSYSKVFEEARDFAGADWERLKHDSRRRLLEANGLRVTWAGNSWGKLPESAKRILAESLIGNGEIIQRRKR